MFSAAAPGTTNLRSANRNRNTPANRNNNLLELEGELLSLQQDLESGRYQPSGYRQFWIKDRKPRLVSAAPIRDRIVHHAVMNVVEPWLDKKFIDDSYASRRSKGVHAAVDRYQTWARRYAYVMRLDIQSYFPKIDHKKLKRSLAALIGDISTLDLLFKIIDSYCAATPGRGLPVGNVTSQVFANLYLNDIDHYVKQHLVIKGYLRYVDDFAVFSDSKSDLHHYKRALQLKLDEIGLALHPRKQRILPTSEKTEFLGYQLSRDRRWLRNDNGYRFRRRAKALTKACARGECSLRQARASMMSWAGHACHAEADALIREVFQKTVFRFPERPESAAN